MPELLRPIAQELEAAEQEARATIAADRAAAWQRYKAHAPRRMAHVDGPLFTAQADLFAAAQEEA